MAHRYRPKQKYSKKRRQSIFLRWLRNGLIGVLFLGLLVLLIGLLIIRPYAKRVEAYDMDRIDDVEIPSLILDRNGHELGRIFDQNRSIVSIERIPKRFIDALLAQEDQRFYHHKGVDWTGILRAVYLNVKAGEVNQGASTLTMQLARNAFDLKSEARKRSENGIQRKLVEAILALRIEKEFPGKTGKNQILELYLNRVPFGKGFYGVRAASLGYFGKEPKDLTLEECASIVACIKNPAKISPLNDIKKNKIARDHVFRRMKHDNLITKEEWQILIKKPVKLNPKALQRHKSFLYEKIARSARKKVGIEAMSAGGFRIYTTIDKSLQQAAEQGLKDESLRIEGSEAYTHLKMEDYTKNNEKAPGYLQGAVFGFDSKTGEVIVYVGGRNYAESQYDILAFAKKPLGTAFLPFLYACAFEQGESPSSILLDDAFDNRGAMIGGQVGVLGEWGMEVHNPIYEGEITARRGLAASKIGASIQLGKSIGLEEVRKTADRLGITSNDEKLFPRILVGWDQATLPQTLKAYSAFSTNGKVPKEFTYISRIENFDGDVVYKSKKTSSNSQVVLNPEAAYQVHSILTDTSKTGNLSDKANLLPEDFKGAVKTGTPYDLSNAWCLGYNGNIVLGVWMGFLNGSNKAIVEGMFPKEIAFPLWAQMMDFSQENFGAKEIEAPPNLAPIEICESSGQKSTEYCSESTESGIRRTTRKEWVLKKYAKEMGYCRVHGIGEDSTAYTPPKKNEGYFTRLPIEPIRPKGSVLIGRDPYKTQQLSLQENDDVTEEDSVSPFGFLKDNGTVRGEKESSIYLILPAPIRITTE